MSQEQKLTWKDGAAILAVGILVVGFFWKMVFTDLILPRGDAFTYFYPYWDYRNVIMQTGRLPLWNPYLFMGVPFLANSQAGVFYPPNWLTLWMSAPEGIKFSALLHLIWAGGGMYLFGRKSLRLSLSAAVLTATLFALGGYLTAQVEHINQVQGLAWLPWLFFLWTGVMRGRHRWIVWIAAAFAMQMLAGHMQTAFISGVGLGVWAIWHTITTWKTKKIGERLKPVGVIGIGSILALGLAAIQLQPTLELSSMSHRSEGLSFLEAVSFSFKPHYIGRGLIPSYGAESLFSEYVAFIGIIGLVLAIIGAWENRRDKATLGLILLGGLGMFFALGAYNPVYWGLVRFVPGFDLFRVPARWLVLYAFSVSALAGIGFDAIQPLPPTPSPQAGRGSKNKRISKVRWIIVGVILILIGLTFAAPLASDPIPGATAPAITEIVIWLISLGLGIGAIWWVSRGGKHAPSLLLAVVVVELFVGSRNLPYNDLSASAAWTSQRPSISTILAAEADSIPPSRYLSMSDTRFDPGDLREIETAYGPLLSDEALFDYIVATKQKEILAPNLSMAWGIPAMDGFDGGILPLQDYTRFTSLFLDDEALTPDGRLRENLTAIPDLTWLKISNVRWIITDKVYDAWIDGVYYDLQLPAELTAGESVKAIPPIPFEATTISIIGFVDDEAGLAGGTQIGSVLIYTSDDEPLVQPILVGELTEDPLAKTWPQATTIERVEIAIVEGFPGIITIQGVSIVDGRTGAFVPTTLSQNGESIRLANSGDVKLYEYMDTLPRATLACDPILVDSMDEALETLRLGGGEDPVIQILTPETGGVERVRWEYPEAITCDPADPGEVVITGYDAESVRLEVTVKGKGNYLILSDTWYPGWELLYNHETGIRRLPIERANALFRGVPMPEGEYQLEFRFHSNTLKSGATITITSLLIAFFGLVLPFPAKDD